MKTIEERVNDIPWLHLTPDVKEAVIKAMRELAKDQREKCAESVQATENPYKEWKAGIGKSGRKLERNLAREEEQLMRCAFNSAKERARKAAMNARIE